MTVTENLPRRLNLGCGFDHRDGYLNVDFQDFHHPDLVADVRDLSMLPSGHFAEVVAQDVLEHLDRTDTPAALAEWSRVLAEGGQLELQVPDVVGLARELRERDTVEDHVTLLQCLYGTQAYSGDYHHAGFTDLVLAHYLAEAGFDRIHLQSHQGWMFRVFARKAFASAASPEGTDALAVVHGTGTYEPDTPDTPWRWITPDADLALINTAPEPVPVVVELAVAHPWGRKGAVEVLTSEERVTLDKVRDEPVAHALHTVLRPGAFRIRLRSTAPVLDAPDDTRTLGPMLHRFDVRRAG